MGKTVAVKEVTIQEARGKFDELLADVEQNQTQIVVRNAGRVIARIVPTPDPEESRRQFFAQVDVLRERFADVPTRELNRLVDRAVKDVRSSRRKKAADAPSSA